MNEVSYPVHPLVQPPAKGLNIHTRGIKGIVKDMRKWVRFGDQMWVSFEVVPYDEGVREHGNHDCRSRLGGAPEKKIWHVMKGSLAFHVYPVWISHFRVYE